MSFGSGGQSNQAKTAANSAQGTANTALNSLFPQLDAAGSSLLGQGGNLLGVGGGTINSGTGIVGSGLNDINNGANFFNTVMNGNQANTNALLQPSINQVMQGTSNALTAANTLQPRGGGRFATNYAQSFAPQAQIQNLFNSARSGAASALPQIGNTIAGIGQGQQQIGLGQEQTGLGQEGLGANLFNISNSALGTANNANDVAGSLGIQNQKLGNQFWQNFGQGIGGLLTTPIGGGGKNGLLGFL